MAATKRRGGDSGDPGSWASETLPLSVRKELLERELDKLGFRKVAESSHPASQAQQQQQQPQGESHPQADDHATGDHSE